MLAAVAGCLGDSDDDPGSDPGDPGSVEEEWRDDLDLPGSLVSALAYVYQHGDSLVLGTYAGGQVFRDGGSRLDAALRGRLASVSVDSLVQYGSGTTDGGPPVSVWVGEFELDPSLEVTDRNGFAVHDLRNLTGGEDRLIPDGDVVIATDGAVLVAGKRDQVTATLDSREGR
ncbi:MAG: hypothetical protein J07HX64_01436 [halophilic archaeon J07HX64]|nr:MAG: hypothetical protein J07HX64_01436 [halophilic archaeon J07HX64]